MIEDEVDAVAAALAKAGGLSWHLGQERGPLRLVMNRYRDRARLVIAALERIRAGKQMMAAEPDVPPDDLDVSGRPGHGLCDHIAAGSLVLYRPPGDRRTYLCRVGSVAGGRAYLIPENPSCTGWVDVEKVSHPEVQ